ncbi:tapasin-related protein-like [Discoglossus pictus]
MIPRGLLILLLIHQTCAVLEVSVYFPSSVLLGTDVTLNCTFKVDSQRIDRKFLAVFWYLNGKEILKLDNKGTTANPRYGFNEQDTEKGNASLYLKKVTPQDEGIYKCTIVYSPESQSQQAPLTVYALPVISKLEKYEVNENEDKVICSVTNLYPKDISVTLLRNGNVLNSSVLSNYHINKDGSYSINRTATIPSTERSETKTLSCSVNNAFLKNPLEKEIQLIFEGANGSTVIPIVIGVIAAVVIITILILFVYFKRKKATL